MTHPAASKNTLALRARLLSRVRAFFAARGVLEVDTPALSRTGTPDPAVESVAAKVRSLGPSPAYLHTSPELAMKRLLVGGSGDIYQICRVYRDDELGRWHQPEFTLLEWYRQGWDEIALMTEVEQLLDEALATDGSSAGARPAVRVSYARAFAEHLGVDPHGDLAALPAVLCACGIGVPGELDDDGLLDLAFSAAVAPRFAPAALTFVYDFPASQAALARVEPRTPAVAARFEVFSAGIELANGFAELTDAAEQRRRFAADIDRRRRLGRDTPPLDEDFLAALERGLPACAGVAVGVDRLVALAAGLDNVAAAMSFAHGPAGTAP